MPGPAKAVRGGHYLNWVTSVGARSQASGGQKPPEATAQLSGVVEKCLHAPISPGSSPGLPG